MFGVHLQTLRGNAQKKGVEEIKIKLFLGKNREREVE